MRLNEALDLSTLDKAVEGIKSGSIGEKVPTELKLYIGPEGGIKDIENYLKGAEEAHADKTKTIQMAVRVAAHSENPVEGFHLWSTRELCQNLAKYGQSDWLKNNEKYKSLGVKGAVFTRHDFEELRAFIRSESMKHGKNTKGTGAKKNNDVELLYKDANWILLRPKSWEAEKKIAFFTNDMGEKEKCHWCTASGNDISWYNKYTYSNTKPLYVMINKEDQAWQLAYYPSEKRVEFLNEFDQKDVFTKGGWMDELPMEMQEKIVNEFNGRSLADYTRAKNGQIGMEEEPFTVKFLPYVEISGKPDLGEDFDAFMLDTQSKLIKSKLALYIRIRTRPNNFFRFSITEAGPKVMDDMSMLFPQEKKFIKTALLQYMAEAMGLDVDYTKRFDALLEEIKKLKIR